MVDQHTTRHDELLPAYALGALEGEELAALEAHLASGCAECAAELRRWQATLEELAEAAEPVEPSETARARVLRGAQAAAPAAARRRVSWAAIAAALLTVALLWTAGAHRGARREVGRLAAESGRLAQRLAALQADLASARTELARLERAAGIAASPGVRSILLAGLEAAPGASAHALHDPAGRRAVLFADNLPELASGRTYQLWVIAAGRPVPAGVFAPDPQGGATLLVEEVPPLEQIQAWAVTVEPEGGMPQPTGAMVLRG